MKTRTIRHAIIDTWSEHKKRINFHIAFNSLRYLMEILCTGLDLQLISDKKMFLDSNET